jgi:hypothetical protein
MFRFLTAGQTNGRLYAKRSIPGRESHQKGTTDMKASFALLLVAVTGCLTASTGYLTASAVAASERTDFASCGKVTGAKWVFPNTGGKVTGNKYGVTVNGVSCAMARKYAVMLSGAKLPGKIPGHSYPLAGGPKGYTCHANPDANGKVLAGSCQIGPLTAVSKHVFSWGGRP